MKKLQIENIKGLTGVEAEEKLKNEGFNEIQPQKPASVFVMLFKVLCEPMLLLLLASGAIYLLLGEAQDAIMLLFFVFVVIGITLYQERKTERALEVLKKIMFYL